MNLISGLLKAEFETGVKNFRPGGVNKSNGVENFGEKKA
jgi:hypothetical protein